MKKKGYANTTVRDIASAVSMEAASLYNHIASKEDLLAQTCFDLASKFEKGILEVNDIYFDAKEKLRMAIDSHTEILTSNLNASYVFLHEWRNLSPDKLADFKLRRDSYEREFIEILKLGEREGTFSEVDEKFVVITILSTINATIRDSLSLYNFETLPSNNTHVIAAPNFLPTLCLTENNTRVNLPSGYMPTKKNRDLYLSTSSGQIILKIPIHKDESFIEIPLDKIPAGTYLLSDSVKLYQPLMIVK